MATQAAFDQAMQNDDVAWLIENTFMARVPELVASGMTIEEAVHAAYERELELCSQMIAPSSWWRGPVGEMRDVLTEQVYARAREFPYTPAINPRWQTCVDELGHWPTVREFMAWHRAQG